MRTSYFVLSALKAAALLIFATVIVSSCGTWNCPENPPPSTTTTTAQPCRCVQPVVTVLESGGFNLTFDTLSGATTVVVYVMNGNGVPIDTVTAAPGQTKQFAYLLDKIARPIRLRVVYQSASGETLGESCLAVDDTGGNGNTLPDVDVVVGYNGSPVPSCGNLNNSTTPFASGTGTLTFAWAPGDLIEVRFTQTPGGPSKKIRLLTSASPAPLAGITRVYNQTGYTCLDNLSMQNQVINGQTITTVLQVSVGSSSDCTITGTDSNVQGSPREIKIVGPTGWAIAAFK